MTKYRTLGKRLKLAVVALAVSLIASCVTVKEVEVPRMVSVAVLPFPTLPTITPEQEAAIEDDTYVELSAREETLIQHIDKQRHIIRTHNRRSGRNRLATDDDVESSDNKEDEERRMELNK